HALNVQHVAGPARRLTDAVLAQAHARELPRGTELAEVYQRRLDADQVGHGYRHLAQVPAQPRGVPHGPVRGYPVDAAHAGEQDQAGVAGVPRHEVPCVRGQERHDVYLAADEAPGIDPLGGYLEDVLPVRGLGLPVFYAQDRLRLGLHEDERLVRVLVGGNAVLELLGHDRHLQLHLKGADGHLDLVVDVLVADDVAVRQGQVYAFQESTLDLLGFGQRFDLVDQSAPLLHVDGVAAGLYFGGV